MDSAPANDIRVKPELLPPLDLVWFAGGGGSSEGAKRALRKPVDYALNHNPVALAMHEANSPTTMHLCADVWDVAPEELEPGRRIRSMWFSPDCTHFSRARGSAPVSPRIRGLMFSIVPWARTRRPDVIFFENVVEARTAGPLYPIGHVLGGRPIPERAGEDFDRLVHELESLGYVCEFRELALADVGVPTTRLRLYGIMRCDGLPIVWPERTHAPRKAAKQLGLKVWRGFDQVADWSQPCHSIFLTTEEGKAAGVRRPLVAATERRIAKGLERYVLTGEPYIVPITNRSTADGTRPVTGPLRTITGSKGGEFMVAKPVIVPLTHHGERHSPDAADPLPTITAAHRGEMALAATTLIRTDMQSDGRLRGLGSVEEPVRTITSANGHALAAAYLGRQFGSTVSGRDLRDPHPTVMSNGGGAKSQIVAVTLDRAFGKSAPGAAEQPLPTISGHAHESLIAANLTSYYATGVGSSCAEPMRTATAADRHALTAAHLEQANTGMVGRPATSPISTTVGKMGPQRLIETRLEAMGASEGTRRRQVLEFLWAHFGEPDDADWADPTGTLQARRRFGLVILQSVIWEIADIGMRMLTVRELFSAQGFPPDYIIDVDAAGRRITKTSATLMVGNSVSPVMAEVLYAAQFPDAAPRFHGDDQERRAA